MDGDDVNSGPTRVATLLEFLVLRIPTGEGVMTGMIWNRRDVLRAPIFFTMLFVGWTWTPGQPGSVPEFLEQVHTDEKSTRRPISEVGLILVNGRGVIKAIAYFAVISLM